MDKFCETQFVISILQQMNKKYNEIKTNYDCKFNGILQW